MRFVLVGNYGVANLGDEALKEYFLTSFPDIDWVVLSAHPKKGELPRLPAGIRSLFFTPWWKTVRAIAGADGLVFGGGSLFTDIESVVACVIWSLHAATALFFRTPVFLAFQGMGPYKTRMGEWLSRWTARRAVFISVRDLESFQRVESWKLSTKLVQTFDPVFSLMVEKKYSRNTKKLFTIIPRHNSSELLQKTALECIKKHPEIDTVNVLLMQPDSSPEQATAQSLQTSLTMPSTVVPVQTLDDLMHAVGGSSLVLTQRFHGALAALAAGTPQIVLPQEPGDKLSQVQKYTEMPDVTAALLSQVKNGHDALAAAMRLH